MNIVPVNLHLDLDAGIVVMADLDLGDGDAALLAGLPELPDDADPHILQVADIYSRAFYDLVTIGGTDDMPSAFLVGPITRVA